MKYIGSYFKMNNLSKDNMKSQLFFFAKESIKTISLQSKCGIELKDKLFNKTNHINDTNTECKFYPLLCLYKKASPALIHTRLSTTFDTSSFRKEIYPASSALMTLCLLELSSYYDFYDTKMRKNISMKKIYNSLSKKQLDFYYENLRNDEGFFTAKKVNTSGNINDYSLISLDKKVTYEDQAFMMLAYYLYATIHYSNDNQNENDNNDSKEESNNDDYKNFSLEIFEMFMNYKNELYSLSFDECLKILFCFNVFYKYSNKKESISFIADLCDFLIAKFDSKNYYESSIENTALFALCLNDSYNITKMNSFKDKSNEIICTLKNLYDSEKHIFIKQSNSKKDKKEIKYSCTDIIIYFLCLIMLDSESPKEKCISINTNSNILSNVYKKMIINSGIISCFPEAPTLDEAERYRNLSLAADDMMDEICFRMPKLQTPKLTSQAPIFFKNIIYSKKKNTFSCKHKIFDSTKNLFIYYLILYYLKDNIEKQMGFVTT